MMITNRIFFTKSILALVLILFLSCFLRLYRLPQLAKISYDESRDLIAEREIITQHKITLIGPETTVGGTTFYFGPLHYYLMAPALLASNYNPLGPNVWTAIIGCLTALVIFITTKKARSAIFFAVFLPAVVFNRWAWNPNTIPFFVAFAYYFLTRKKLVFAGVFLGLATQLHFSVIICAILFIALGFKENKINGVLKLILGFAIGILPLILFDLRHDFFNFKNVLNAFFANKQIDREFTWHYFLWLLPLISIFIGNLKKHISIILICLSFIVTIYWLFSQKENYHLNPKTIEEISKVIAKNQRDSELNFNVATFTDSDSRATSYRYFLSLENLKPLSVLEYSVADHLYIITFDSGEKTLMGTGYEVKSFSPKKYQLLGQFKDSYLYRLDK